ncbi:MAG: response regulator [Patescibacteria group bacterium]|jgi:DNA-binding response OmpR family regulator
MQKNEKTILIIDDDTSLRWLLDKAFSRENFRVFKAKNGQLGLEIAMKERPDLILLDIVMPKMDGLTVLSKIRSSEWGLNVPLILWTNVDKKEIAQLLKYDDCVYMAKAKWALEDLVKEVKIRLKIKV